jgi:hypothetical protein
MKAKTVRNGLRIITESGIHPEVKRACLEFAKWLRLNFEFPIRVRVYLKRNYQIKSRYTKEMVSATFLAPFDKTEEPHIRISTGDYIELFDKLGQDSALGAILGSIAHELGHYYQWIDDIDLDEDGADNNREYMLDLYRETRKHP